MRKNPTLPLVFASLLLGLYAPGASAADDALELFAGTDGRTQVQTGGRTLGALDVACFDKAWRGAGALAEKGDGPDEQTHLIRMRTPFGAVFKGSIRMAAEGEAAAASLKLTPDKPAELNSLHIAGEFPVANCLGGSWKTDSAEGAFPENLDPDKIHLFGNKAKFLELTLAGGANVRFEFPQPTSVLIQDNRKWSRDFVIRLILAGEGDNGQTYQAGKEYELAFRIASRGGVKLTHDKPLVLVANEEWKPLKTDLRIEPGSALDFSELGFLDAPAGKHGWIQTNAQGQFVFEKRPDKPVRFYGVNFCFSANYMTHEQSDELAERLARLGYNAIRIHHYEGELCQGQPLSTTFNPEKLDQLDYLLAACFKRGIYATTDLYVSRPIKKSELGLPGDGNEGRFKELAHIHGGAFANWKLFSKNLLEHVNPYTRRSWAEEPGLAWICMLNEDNLANHINTLLEIPEWVRAWNAWLAARYETREKLNAAWEGKLKDGQDPAQGNVEMLGNIHSRGDPRQKDLAVLLAESSRRSFERMKQYVRDELGCKALLTDFNGWTNLGVDAWMREPFDYVDDHFYIDHPQFIEQAWRLPSRCPNTSPIAGGAHGGRGNAFVRLFDKPFTITEYNYSGPGRFRGVGGILTGALGALQDWGALWRFAYSHNRNHIFTPYRMDYFNMCGDPLSQAAERAALLLYLRGDMQPAPHRLAIALTPEDAQRPGRSVPGAAPRWDWAAWLTRVGYDCVADPAAKLEYDLVLPVGWATKPEAFAGANLAAGQGAYEIEDDALLAALKEKILPKGNRSDPKRNVLESETGELFIDGANDVMVLDTPRTAGGYAPDGKAVEAPRGGVRAVMAGSDATVWVSALDDRPITSSKRLLVTHLTDLQNTEIRYGERARQTLLEWGKLPHLVRAGRAEVRVKLDEPGAYKVWSLATNGKRVAELKPEVKDGALVFTADVAAGGEEEGARMLYEIARE